MVGLTRPRAHQDRNTASKLRSASLPSELTLPFTMHTSTLCFLACVAMGAQTVSPG